MLTAPQSFRDLPIAQRQALLERLASSLARNAEWASIHGDDALEIVMRSVGKALHSVARDLAMTDVVLGEEVATRAMTLIATFQSRHPEYAARQTLH